MSSKILKNSRNQKFVSLRKKKKIVLCHGVFDLLHVGHLNHFEKAKSHGDILVVSITPDKFVNKGPSRPAFEESVRLEMLASLEIVDFVYLNNGPSSANVIKEFKPEVYCKGPDYKDHKKDLTNNIKLELKAIRSVKGKIVYTDGQTFSSGNLINKFSNNLSELTKKNINKIKSKYSFDKIKSIIDSFSKLKVLVIGEVIIDEYIFCDALGKSGKDPILAFKFMKSEKYLGGSGAISRNLLSFSKNISLFSMIGEKKDELKFINSNLRGIKYKLLNKKNSPTITKKRFLDLYSNNKVLGVYNINDDNLDDKNENNFKKMIKQINAYDLVIVSDYGHGLISEKNAKLICKKSKFLALNAQVNAANIGFHSLKKYRNVNSVIINEKEIRHELRDKNGNIKKLMKKLADLYNFKTLIVTQGKSGSIMYNKIKNNFIQSDAFAKSAIDKIGAGDTLLALISLCLKKKLDENLSLLIGSIAAALSVKDYGNKKMINKIEIQKSLENLLK